MKTHLSVFLLRTIQLVFFRLASCWPNFHFYPFNNSEMFILTKDDYLAGRGFNSSNPTVFIVHGFGSHGREKRFLDMKDKFKNNAPQVNLIVVDWEYGAVSANNYIWKVFNYLSAIVNSRSVGKDLSVFIKKNSINPRTVTCIGHSLGAHLCGFMGKNLPGLGRISGLDPAGPLFKYLPASQRLNKEDAAFVDCIYTSMNTGIVNPICQVNFYPNFLDGQPQCGSNDETCNHVSAVHYYTESIAGTFSCRFLSAKCKDYQTRCPLCSNKEPNNCLSMGYYASQLPNSQGNYVLETNRFIPYCKN